MIYCILTQCVTFIHNQSHNSRPRYTIISIINAQISLVPRLPLSFLLVLPVIESYHSACVYTPHFFTGKQFHKHT